MKLSNTINRIKKINKKVLILAAVFAAIAIPVTVRAAWGPDRPVFDWNNPADRKGSTTGPVFNSFINTPTYGDERNFTTASPANQAVWRDEVAVQPGQEYDVRVFVHNNANQDTNASGVGVAKNTRVRVALPSGYANGFDVAGYVSADNAKPQMVYDSAALRNNNQTFALSYVPGSAKIYNNDAFKNGAPLPDGVVSANGTPIGHNDLSGNMPGCFEFQAVVIIRVKVVAPKLQFSKKVTTPGSTNWQKNITAKSGDTVSWLLDYKNVGTGLMKDITLRDTMPANAKLVSGSITWIDENHPNGYPLQDTVLNSGGINLGDAAPRGGGYIRFRTVIDKDPKDCVVKNVAFGRAKDVPEIKDDASVNIENCKPSKPVYSCDLLSGQLISGRKYRFTAKATAQGGATISRYFYNFGDGTEQLTTDRTTVEHTYAKPGNYVSTVRVEVKVDGQTKIAESESCKVTINIPENPETPPTVTTVLPNTGPGDVVGIFAATTFAGALVHRFVLGRRYR